MIIVKIQGVFVSLSKLRVIVLSAVTALVLGALLYLALTIDPKEWSMAVVVALLISLLCVLGVIFLLARLYLRKRGDYAHAKKALTTEREKSATTLLSIEDGVILLDNQGLIDYCNPVSLRLLGLEQDSFHQKLSELLRLTSHNKMLDLGQTISDCLRRGLGFTLPTDTLVTLSGKITALSGSITPIRTERGEVNGAVVVLRDVSQAKALAQRLEYQATHDDLTGLFNRTEFLRRLDLAIQKSKELGIKSLLLYLDLDQFKIVNDSCGHFVGDGLLEKLARLLEVQFRARDSVARLGGDEFAVLLEDCSTENAKRVANKINNVLKRFHFDWNGKSFDISASIGLVELHYDSMTMSEALSLADSACYLAKQEGRNRYHLYRPDDFAMTQHRGEIQWLQKIKQAYDEGRFSLYLQEIRPIHEHKSDDQRHFEVLLRMVGEDEGIILPMSYILAAERYDKMTDLDRWVIINAFHAVYSYLVESEDKKTDFSINISAQSMSDTDIVDFVDQQLKKYPGLNSHIIFEITETAAFANPAQVGRFINQFHAQGVRFSLDDFGSGWSSFANLKTFPVDFLKIDGQFIRDINTDKVSRAVVESINDVAHLMGVKTIAEYVENEDIKNTLASMGIDYGQGVWFSQPCAMEEFLARKKRGQSY